MTTLQNNTIREVILKTSFKEGSLEADLLITLMSNGFNFIHAFRITKKITKKN